MKSSSEPLNISAFRDITSFILETARLLSGLNFSIHYVQDADEAHQDIVSGRRELVFMSYDDTLTLLLEEKFEDIQAVLPIHGGILDLCGSLDAPFSDCPNSTNYQSPKPKRCPPGSSKPTDCRMVAPSTRLH